MADGRLSAERGRTVVLVALALAGVAGLTILLLALLTNIFERRQEARQPFVRVVEVTEATMDPKVWGQNWPAQYDSYLKTAQATTTKYGGRGMGRQRRGPGRAEARQGAVAEAYLRWLRLRDRLPRPPRPLLRAVRPGADAAGDREEAAGRCLQCHASNLALYRFVGKGDVQKGFEQVSAMPYDAART